MAFLVNLNFSQGATAREVFYWKNKDTGVPFDLTGCTAALKIRSRMEATDTLASLSSPANGIVLGTTDGRIDVTLPISAMTAGDWRTAVYDLFITFADGTKQKLLMGRVNVTLAVTRD